MSRVLVRLVAEKTAVLEPARRLVPGGRSGAYGVAVLAALAGLTVTALSVKPLAGPFFVFEFAAVVGAALYGGLGPGLLATALSCAGSFAMFLVPAPEGYAAYRFASFALVSVVFVWLPARMRHAKGEAEASQYKAEASETDAKVIGAEQERLMTVAEAALARAEAAETEARLIGDQQERLVAVVSHDLRSPLNAITVSAQYLQLDASERQVKGLSRIVTSAGRMQSMIHDLLDFARVRHGSALPVKLQPARLGDICRSVLEEVRTAKPDRVVLLDVTGDDSATLDPARVEQVVSNLVTNALTHGAADAPVKVSVTEASSGIRLDVTNQGAPIPPHLVPALFRSVPFRRCAREHRLGPLHRERGRARTRRQRLGPLGRSRYHLHGGVPEGR